MHGKRDLSELHDLVAQYATKKDANVFFRFQSIQEKLSIPFESRSIKICRVLCSYENGWSNNRSTFQPFLTNQQFLAAQEARDSSVIFVDFIEALRSYTTIRHLAYEHAFNKENEALWTSLEMTQAIHDGHTKRPKSVEKHMNQKDSSSALGQLIQLQRDCRSMNYQKTRQMFVIPSWRSPLKRMIYWFKRFFKKFRKDSKPEIKARIFENHPLLKKLDEQDKKYKMKQYNHNFAIRECDVEALSSFVFPEFNGLANFKMPNDDLKKSHLNPHDQSSEPDHKPPHFNNLK